MVYCTTFITILSTYNQLTLEIYWIVYLLCNIKYILWEIIIWIKPFCNINFILSNIKRVRIFEYRYYIFRSILINTFEARASNIKSKNKIFMYCFTVTGPEFQNTCGENTSILLAAECKDWFDRWSAKVVFIFRQSKKKKMCKNAPAESGMNVLKSGSKDGLAKLIT